jgi:nicotinamide-nucleotide amidase
VERDGKTIVCMPGPPRELTNMWETEVRGRLREKAKGDLLVSRTLKVTGISEGGVDELCGDLINGTNPTIGVYARPDGIHVRMAAKAVDEQAAWKLIDPVEQQLRTAFGSHLWGVDDETMAASVGSLLKERGMTLAVMESCTGGLLGSAITDVPGSSAYFKGGFITYTNDAKIAYGVDPALIEEHGAVSADVARAMASAARRNLGADIGIGITGVAGPDEQDGKPVGTVFIGLDHDRKGVEHGAHHRTGRADVKLRSVTAALFQLRALVLELNGT